MESILQQGQTVAALPLVLSSDLFPSTFGMEIHEGSLEFSKLPGKPCGCLVRPGTRHILRRIQGPVIRKPLSTFIGVERASYNARPNTFHVSNVSSGDSFAVNIPEKQNGGKVDIFIREHKSPWTGRSELGIENKSFSYGLRSSSADFRWVCFLRGPLKLRGITGCAWRVSMQRLNVSNRRELGREPVRTGENEHERDKVKGGRQRTSDEAERMRTRGTERTDIGQCAVG